MEEIQTAKKRVIAAPAFFITNIIKGGVSERDTAFLKKLKLGGTQQIRTAVHGFADRYLATRSGYQIGKAKRCVRDSNP